MRLNLCLGVALAAFGAGCGGSAFTEVPSAALESDSGASASLVPSVDAGAAETSLEAGQEAASMGAEASAPDGTVVVALDTGSVTVDVFVEPLPDTTPPVLAVQKIIPEGADAFAAFQLCGNEFTGGSLYVYRIKVVQVHAANVPDETLSAVSGAVVHANGVSAESSFDDGPGPFTFNAQTFNVGINAITLSASDASGNVGKLDCKFTVLP